MQREVAQLGSAPGLGPGGRRFKSCLPDHLFGALAQLGERLLCTQEVRSSILLGSTNLINHIHGGIAQLARAFGSYPECRGFKSLSRYHLTQEVRSSILLGSTNLINHIHGGIAQLARAFGSYPECRGFKSLSRYHLIKKYSDRCGPLAQLVRATGS